MLLGDYLYFVGRLLVKDIPLSVPSTEQINSLHTIYISKVGHKKSITILPAIYSNLNIYKLAY